ncbi:hypothetical protein Bca101_004316 [Brassica carinata]
MLLVPEHNKGIVIGVTRSSIDADEINRKNLLAVKQRVTKPLSDESFSLELSAPEGSLPPFLASELVFSASLDKAVESEWLSFDEYCTSVLSGPSWSTLQEI